MKNEHKSTRILAVFLSILTLTNCTAYNVVRQPLAGEARGGRIVLYKDGLEFVLDPVAVRNDTLFATLADAVYLPPKGTRTNIYLISGQEIPQDSAGILAIPFAWVDHTEYYVKDRHKTRQNILLAACGSLVLVTVVFSALLISGLHEALSDL